LLYGAPKTGKTRLATSLPWGNRWGEKAIYVAFDPGAESLASVRKLDRGHLVVVRPALKQIKRRKLRAGDSEFEYVMDPHTEANAIASRPWQTEYPGVGTLIWDTETETAEQLLRAYANTGVFSGEKGDKHITVGIEGTDGYMALPMMADYGIAQNAISQINNLLFNQPLNIIVICHADISSPQNAEIAEATFGGPATVGQKGIARIAGKFDNLFRTEKRTRKPPGAASALTEYRVFTEGRGIWLGGMRTPDNKNPMPEFTVGLSDKDLDPTDFWRRFEEIQDGV